VHDDAVCHSWSYRAIGHPPHHPRFTPTAPPRAQATTDRCPTVAVLDCSNLLRILRDYYVAFF
jgi:hypothetical protein